MARKKTIETPTEAVSGAVATVPGPSQPPSTADAVIVSDPASPSVTSDGVQDGSSGSSSSSASSGAVGTGSDPDTGSAAATVSELNSGDSSASVGSGAAGNQGDTGNEAESSATAGAQPPDSLNPAAVNIYPIRSYLDEGELRRRGGPSYPVPRRHADALVQRSLASFTPLEE